MKKISMLYALCSMLFALCAQSALAVCPVCTIAVGVGLEGMRILGVDDVITGIWAGGLILSMIMWTAGFMHRKGVKNGYWYLFMLAVYVLLVASVWWLPNVHFGAETFMGIDKFLFGIIVGAVVFYAAAKWHAAIKKSNGGASWFPMQKVVWPVGALTIATAIFACVIYL